MAKFVSIHSFRGGTGKSNTTANIAAILAAEGRRVGVVDTDIQSPGIHVLFGLETDKITHSLNDYLRGTCSIEQATYDVTKGLGANISGKVFLIPSSINANEIAEMTNQGYDFKQLYKGLYSLIGALNLDLLIIDTHPGLGQETLLSIAISDQLVILLRPDSQDYQGTSVTVEVARLLEIPRLSIVVNNIPDDFDQSEVQKKVSDAYKCQVVAVLPHANEMMTLASSGIFALHYPNHPVTIQFRLVANSLMA